MKFINNIFGLIVTVTTLTLFLGVLLLWQLSRGLPDYTHLENYTPPLMSRVHAGDGTLIAEYAQQRRLFVPIETIPQYVLDAFLAAEDKDFYTHVGIDFQGLARASVQNVLNLLTGRRLEGGSTITQQVAKNFLLSSEVSIERKIKEAILALRLERTFSKSQILELYLNEIYFGLGSYGVAAASLNYFDKHLSELTLAEAAYLAALPKAPNNYHPRRYLDRAIARRNWVLARMVENNYTTPEQAEAASAAELIVTDRPRGVQNASVGHFAEQVRRQIADIYGQRTLYGGGLSIRSTLDTKLQALALRSLRDGLEDYDRRQGWRGAVARIENIDKWFLQLGEIQNKIFPADVEHRQLAVVLEVNRERAKLGLHNKGSDNPKRGRMLLTDMRWARTDAVSKRLKVGDVIWVAPRPKTRDRYLLRQLPEVNGAMMAMDPHTGRILAMVGGYSSRASEFNRAVQARRQPGSGFKPFVYAAALDSGFTPSSLILDAPFVIEQGNDQGLWKPENFARKFYGTTTLRRGVEHSRNLMTVRLAHEIGMNKVSHYARRFDIMSSMPPVLSMSLGAGETTLQRLTAAYAMLVNGGKKVSPVFIDRIQDRYGKTLHRNDTRACVGCVVEEWGEQTPPELADEREQILSPQTAYQIVSILEGVVQRGTGKRIRSVQKTLAGKTGTTNDNRDAWFMGFSPDLVVGVYVGYDDNRTLGKNNTGSRVAAPIFKNFMEKALRGVSTPPFRIPSDISLVRINRTSGKAASAEDEPSQIILEAFKRGTEPGRASQNNRVVRGNVGTGSPIASAPRNATPQRRILQTEIGEGSGGVY